VARHGPIAAFVAQHGWPAFRAREEELVGAAVRPGTIVATGGGAIESERTRACLRERALVVWLDADSALLRERLDADAHDRPSIPGAPVADEIPAVLALRTPLYRDLAHVRIDAALPVAAQVELALRELGKPCRWP